MSHAGKGPRNPGHIIRNGPFPGIFWDPIVTFQTASKGKSDRRRSCFSLADWLSLRNVRYRKLGSTEFYVAALPEEATAAFARADAAPHLPARHTSRPQSATPLL